MRKRVISVIFIAFISLMGVFVVALADSANSSVWQNFGNPTVQKVLDLPPNILPSKSNSDCTPATVRKYASTAMQTDCLTLSAVGQAGGEGIVFNGASEMIPVVPPSPYQGLQPVPNQSLFTTTTNASVLGSYLHFYRAIYNKLPALPTNTNGVWQMKLTAGPDFSIRDNSNNLMAVNTSTMAYSKSGSWMVADLIGKGMVRINMATFEILPFAPSLQPPNDYSDVSAQLAISDDGQNVVIKPSNANYLKLYSLTNCSDQSLPIAYGATPCPVRDYWSDLTNQIPNFRGIYQPRFINNSQISVTSIYDFTPGNFKVASYTLTAPGVSPTGIDYLGMGDSFASGEGAFSYLASTDTADNVCHLSTKSYALILSAQIFSSGHVVSCSGAVTNDINGDVRSYLGQTVEKIARNDRPISESSNALINYTPGYLVQSEFIDTYKPEAITLSIGGNNMGFNAIITSCVSPAARPKACYPTYEDRLELNQKINGIFNDLVNTYKSVAKPGKRVYAIGYPQIVVPDGNCGYNVHFESSEIEMAVDLIDYLNQTISRAADKAGVRYVDVSDAFVGHRMCETTSDQIAVNGLTAGRDTGLGPVKIVGKESYHPNALGHELLAQAIRGKTNNLTQAMPNATNNTTAPALPPDGRNLPKTGRPTSNLLFDDSITSDVVLRGQPVAVQPGTTFKPGGLYKISAGGLQFGTATASAQGALNYNGQLPAAVEPGFQTIHITGPNLVGQPLDVTKTIYVAAASDDYDGDGLPDASDSCRIVPNAGKDVDQDGIDDACDPLIGTPPPIKLTNLKVSVTLIGNSITLTKN